MIFEEILQVVDQLSENDRQRLRQYLDQNKEQIRLARGLTPEERIQRLNAALDAIREGLTHKELDEMTAAMNEEYIEPWDESEWTDSSIFSIRM